MEASQVETRDVHRPRGTLGQKNPENYFKEKSIFMSSGRYLCIVYVKLKVKKNQIPSTE
jgi:hypothetical protein